MRSPVKGQFSGCLVGQCLGDALGFLREGWPRADCEEYVDGAMGTWRQGCADQTVFSGQYTDDSQLARELMQSYLASGGFDPADYARRIAAIFVEDRIVGRGMATHNAAKRLAEGASWDEAGTPPPDAGNGSAMRAAPIGLFFDDPRQLIRAAHDQGRITHQDPRASAGAVAIAGAVHLALRMQVIDRAEFLCQLAAWTAAFDAGFAESIRQLDQWVDLPVDVAVDGIADLGLAPGAVNSWDRISPFVVPSVIWSLYSFLRSPNDYWESISSAIRVGGDVDTTAAMTGAISGAHLGLKQLPAHLTILVNDFDDWRYEHLVNLAESCFDLATNR